MYVFDTNVISEIMKDSPDPAVAAWLRACPVEALCTTAVCQSEILYGVRRLPESRRRYRLSAAAAAMFAESFAERILPFDAAAASAYADIRSARGTGWAAEDPGGSDGDVEDAVVGGVTPETRGLHLGNRR
jgi:predicted nucleic acid-binding protein